MSRSTLLTVTAGALLFGPTTAEAACTYQGRPAAYVNCIYGEAGRTSRAIC